ncbi:MAG: hypothetical protein ACYDAG_08005 [Chloroflexota bacterium]
MGTTTRRTATRRTATRTTILSIASALTLAGGLVGSAHAGSTPPAPPSGTSEITGAIVWHEHHRHSGKQSLVLATGSGDVLVVVPEGTPVYRRYWGDSNLGELHAADSLNVWGTPETASGGHVMAARMIQDTSIQNAAAQATGQVLFRDDGFAFIQVTSKPNGSPIGDLLTARHNPQTRITLPNGQPGTWNDVTRGRTVEVAGTYDRASQSMFDTDHVNIQA